MLLAHVNTVCPIRMQYVVRWFGGRFPVDPAWSSMGCVQSTMMCGGMEWGHCDVEWYGMGTL